MGAHFCASPAQYQRRCRLMVNTTVVTEVLEEKMPESPWHNYNVGLMEDLFNEIIGHLPNAFVFRDIFFQFSGKRYAPDIAIVLQGAPPFKNIGLVYQVPEDGPAPDAIVEVAVSPKSLGEAISEKADFYGSMGVKDYLVVEAFPDKPMRLWFCRLEKGESPTKVSEAKLETLKITVKTEGQKLKVFDEKGQEILPLRERVIALQEQVATLQEREVTLQERMAILEAELREERKRREELERRLKELEQGKK
ncbi:MAG: Uma2 family endonuclease [Armatimonadetes bacterium]|nr:Uma2 family endonuclease [Armatimonadota bacterium]MDW8029366.1 Uma2 family endonuclease [Armatimonadota bacterium]